MTDGKPAESGGWQRVRGVCHGGKSLPGSVSLRDNQNGIGVKCFGGCDREKTIKALEVATRLIIWDAYEHPDEPVRPLPKQQDEANEPIPADPGHPARRWAARRNLWPAELTFPISLRWIPTNGHPSYPWTMTGAIITPFAPADDWMLAYPRAPNPTGIQLVNLDEFGGPSYDKTGWQIDAGLTKRSLGTIKGTAYLLGEPQPSKRLVIVEGLADGMACYSRQQGETVAVLAGTSGMIAPSDDFMAWAAKFETVTGCPDRDEPGIKAWNVFRRALWASAGRQATTLELPPDCKDAAEWAMKHP